MVDVRSVGRSVGLVRRFGRFGRSVGRSVVGRSQPFARLFAVLTFVFGTRFVFVCGRLHARAPCHKRYTRERGINEIEINQCFQSVNDAKRNGCCAQRRSLFHSICVRSRTRFSSCTRVCKVFKLLVRVCIFLRRVRIFMRVIREKVSVCLNASCLSELTVSIYIVYIAAALCE